MFNVQNVLLADSITRSKGFQFRRLYEFSGGANCCMGILTYCYATCWNLASPECARGCTRSFVIIKGLDIILIKFHVIYIKKLLVANQLDPFLRIRCQGIGLKQCCMRKRMTLHQHLQVQQHPQVQPWFPTHVDEKDGVWEVIRLACMDPPRNRFKLLLRERCCHKYLEYYSLVCGRTQWSKKRILEPANLEDE